MFLTQANGPQEVIPSDILAAIHTILRIFNARCAWSAALLNLFHTLEDERPNGPELEMVRHLKTDAQWRFWDFQFGGQWGLWFWVRGI